jgi:hypothetical protein
MKTLTVQVNSDHLRTLAQSKKPILALAELVWNSLDADAHRVDVIIEDNAFGGFESIKVIDDGHGLDYDDAESEFSNLGGSKKKLRMKSQKCKRLLHGRLGKGRFKAFSLGQYVKWVTRYNINGKTKQYELIGKSDEIDHFTMSDPVDCNSSSGTEVIINNISKNFTTLKGNNAIQEIACLFALYLRQYPDISIIYNGTKLITAHLESSVSDYDIEDIRRPDNNDKIDLKLTIIEWNHPTERSLYLCDSAGFALQEMPVGIQARGFNFTAYIKSDYLKELNEEGILDLELHPSLKPIIDVTRKKLREHFRKRSADQASNLVRNWKEQHIYPYEEEAKNPIEEAERQVFDICALNIHTYLPDFEGEDSKSKLLAFRLLKNALETSPAAIQIILGEVLDLPKQKQEEFAELIKQTSLDSIITASTVVTNRLKFLTGLKMLVFDMDSKKQLLERRQLQRIIVENAWVFGEEFNLSLDDQSLTELLKKHLHFLGKEMNVIEEVKREDGSKGILDLVLGRKIPTPHGEEREFLVVELKRPNYKLDDDSLNQIKSYAFAVANDERFRAVKTKWNFWLVSNDMNESLKRQANQKHLRPGCVHDDSEYDMKIWIKPWSQIITECEGRLNFFQEQLQYRATREDALAYLKTQYNKYLPDVFQEKHDNNEEILNKETEF